MEKFSERLKEALWFAHKNPIDLANHLGIHRATISQYLSGRSSPNQPEKFLPIAEFLGVNPAWLAGYDAPMIDIKIGKEATEMLTNYNKLNNFGKSKADEYVQDLTEQEKYTRQDVTDVVKTA